jgi:hypothetical protein
MNSRCVLIDSSINRHDVLLSLRKLAFCAFPAIKKINYYMYMS